MLTFAQYLPFYIPNTMPALETIDIPLGFEAPDFLLFDTVTGTQQTLTQLRGKHATVIMFLCNHCPFVKHINPELVRLANDYQSKGIAFIAISSNDVEKYPADSPENMRQVAQEQAYPFPYLYDETQDIARAYQAACTPDFNIFDAQLLCVYRGQLDNARPSNHIPLSGSDIRAALDAILQKQPIAQPQRPSIGCSIKWKS
jgi:thiol-disulfide isomerase/thioredoxin